MAAVCWLLWVMTFLLYRHVTVALPDGRSEDYRSSVDNNEVHELPGRDECAILNQVQSVVIQVLNTHYEYGKGIRMLHNIVDTLQDDFSVLKGKLDDLDRRVTADAAVNQTKYKGYHSNNPNSYPVPTLDPLTFRSGSATARSIQSMHWSLRNLTEMMHTQNQHQNQLEKIYMRLRRKLKKMTDPADLLNSKNKDEDQRPMLEHYMDKQTDINTKLLRRVQALEQRIKVQGDSPYVENNGCPPGFVRHYTSCYKFFNETANWIDSEKSCQGLNPDAHLVSIETNEEAEYLVKYRIHNREHWTSSYIWTGGNDMADEGVWRWVGTGAELTYTNWRTGQPDNFKDQHCVYYRADGADPRWDDWHCYGAKLNFVCEIILKA